MPKWRFGERKLSEMGGVMVSGGHTPGNTILFASSKASIVSSVVCPETGHAGEGWAQELHLRAEAVHCPLETRPRAPWMAERIYGGRGGWGPPASPEPVQGACGRNLESATSRHLGVIFSVCQKQCMSQMSLLCAQLSASCHHFQFTRSSGPATWQQPHLFLFSSYEFELFCT